MNMNTGDQPLTQAADTPPRRLVTAYHAVMAALPDGLRAAWQARQRAVHADTGGMFDPPKFASDGAVLVSVGGDLLMRLCAAVCDPAATTATADVMVAGRIVRIPLHLGWTATPLAAADPGATLSRAVS